MEEVQKNQNTTPDIPQQFPKKQTNVWRIISIILIIVLVGAGAFIFGKNQSAPSKTTPAQTSAKISDAPTQALAVSPTIIPSPSLVASTKITAGINNQFFSVFTISVPSDWTANKTDKSLTLTKGQNTLTISQNAGGAGSCIFPGESPAPMAQTFTDFVGITGVSSQFRRGITEQGPTEGGNAIYNVCEQKSGGYAFPTSYGYITYNLADGTNKATLAEMDAMLASLTK